MWPTFSLRGLSMSTRRQLSMAVFLDLIDRRAAALREPERAP